MPTTKEALLKAQAAVDSSFQSLRTAVGMRHYLMGVNGKKGDSDLYWMILNAETSLRALEEELKETLLKFEEQEY